MNESHIRPREYSSLDNSSNRNWKLVGIRAGIIALALVGIILNVIYGFVLPHSEVDCILDYTFIYTSKLNSFFANEQAARNFLLIFSSLCVDLVLVTVGIMWIAFGKSWRFFISLVTIYLFKCLVHFLFLEKIPDGYLWDYPGFPSITITYFRSNDFFFSLPVGFLVICALECWKVRNYYLFSFAIVSTLLEIITRISLRGNYIIDLLSAITIAHYIFIIADEYCPKYIDSLDIDWINNSNKELEIENQNNQPQKYENENKNDYKILNHKDREEICNVKTEKIY
jgi:hypothetical protein